MIKQKLTPIKFLYREKKYYRQIWLFKCECGKEVEKLLNHYKSGNTKSCGCLVTNPPINKRSKDLTGEKFNKLLAIKRFKKRNKRNISQVYYECICDCGNKTEVKGTCLVNNNTKSCGCLDKETLIKRNKNPTFISKRSNKVNKKYKINHWKTNEEIYCTGSWEYGVILYLNKNKIDFKWQIPFELRHKTYICDLYLINENKYVEIKGRFLKDALEKLKEFKELYPNLNFEIWDRTKLFLFDIINNQGVLKLNNI